MATGSYINGKWFHPASKQLVRNINPADPTDIIAEFPAATGKDVQAAVEAAESTFPQWKNTPGPERGRILWRAADIARKRSDEIARIMTREEGKTLKESVGEVMKGIALLEYYAGAGFRMGGQTLPTEGVDMFAYTLRRPLGVVGLILPFNFPWACPVWKSAPALIAGNTIVMKPADLTPSTAALLIEIYAEAGVPPGVINMVTSCGSEVGEAIVNAPAVRAISFTGSNPVGEAIYARAATLQKKVTCEMGGKNALVVLADANLEFAAAAILNGAFGSTGQRCTATSRVIVMPEVKDALLEILVNQTKQLKVGNGLDETVDMGPAVDERQLKRDFDYIEIAKGEGARLLCGGNRPAHLTQGFFIEPTIFDNVLPTARIFKEEVFGPVLSIATAKDLEQALQFANSVEYGLTTALFTEDINSAMHYINEVETGMIHINEATIGGEAQLPFGGTKATAIGDREMSDEGLNFFTETKTVFINYAKTKQRSSLR